MTKKNATKNATKTNWTTATTTLVKQYGPVSAYSTPDGQRFLVTGPDGVGALWAVTYKQAAACRYNREIADDVASLQGSYTPADLRSTVGVKVERPVTVKTERPGKAERAAAKAAIAEAPKAVAATINAINGAAVKYGTFDKGSLVNETPWTGYGRNDAMTKTARAYFDYAAKLLAAKAAPAPVAPAPVKVERPVAVAPKAAPSVKAPKAPVVKTVEIKAAAKTAVPTAADSLLADIAALVVKTAKTVAAHDDAIRFLSERLNQLEAANVVDAPVAEVRAN